MNLRALAAGAALLAIATTSTAQNVTTADGDIVMIEKHQTATVAAPTGTPTPTVTGLGGTTGFVQGLGVTGPMMLGLGAIVAIGAISSGGGTP